MATPEKTKAVNKVVINNKTVVDMTGDTAAAADVVSGKFFHSKSGAQQAGTMKGLSTLSGSARPPTIQNTTYTFVCENNGDTGYVLGDAAQRVSVVLEKVVFGAALQEQVLEGKTFTATSGVHVTGTMPNKGAAAIELSDLTAKSVAAGYYSGGTAKIADAEAAKIIPGNIKQGVTLFGVEGTLKDGPYSIASTDNDDGSQNLAITDANAATLEMTEFTITSSVYSSLQAVTALIYYDADGIHMVPGPITLPYTFTTARNSMLRLDLSNMSGMPRVQNAVGCLTQLGTNIYYIVPTAAVASIDLYNND